VTELVLGGRRVDLDTRVLVMGILNRTRDSFYDRGAYWRLDDLLRRAERLVDDGADLLDIGARPGGVGVREVSEAEETDLVAETVAAVCTRFDVPISVDTTRAAVARAAFTAGAVLGNDMSGFREPGYLPAAADAGASVVATHIRLAPGVPDPDPQYDDLVTDVHAALSELARRAADHGLGPGRVVLDPGLDLGKTWQQSVHLLAAMTRFTDLGHPLLLGASNKIFLGRLLGLGIDERTAASVAAAAIGMLRGCRVLRVHDARGARHAADLAAAVLRSDRSGPDAATGDGSAAATPPRAARPAPVPPPALAEADEGGPRMPDAVESHRDTSAGRIRSRAVGERGEGVPEVVVVQGMAVADYLLPAVAELGRWTRAHLVELPGFAGSGEPTRSLDVAGYGAVVAEWLDQARLGPVVLIGHSSGTQVAARAAVQAQARGLGLVGVVLASPTVAPIARPLPRLVVRWQLDGRHEPPGLTESHIREWRRAGLRALVHLVRVHLRDRIEEAVPALRAPVLVLRGAQDRLTTTEWARGLAESARYGRYREVPGAHSFLWGDPAVWSDPVRELARERIPDAPATGTAERRDR
jgi:dihydropteroate synthase